LDSSHCCAAGAPTFAVGPSTMQQLLRPSVIARAVADFVEPLDASVGQAQGSTRSGSGFEFDSRGFFQVVFNLSRFCSLWLNWMAVLKAGSEELQFRFLHYLALVF